MQCQIFKTICGTSWKNKRLSTDPSFYIHINRINNRLVFKIKIDYKLELQTPEAIKLFGSKEKIIDETKKRENIPGLEVAEVVAVQCNFVDK